VSCCLGGSPTNGPNGGRLGGGTSISGYMDVGAFVSSTQMALVGTFGSPSLSTPWSVFTIGSLNDGVVVPVGATTLSLGFTDAGSVVYTGSTRTIRAP
jgi:hypothetical protein